MYKNVHDFKEWWLNYRPIQCTEGSVLTKTFASNNLTGTSTLLFRDGQFQVQMFCIPECTIASEHRHPNVRSYEVYVGGSISFSLDGQWVQCHDQNTPQLVAPGTLFQIFVEKNQAHGGLFGYGGGSFISIQEWINGVNPSCVGLDWDGKISDKSQLGLNGATDNRSLTWKDAATKMGSLPKNWKSSELFKKQMRIDLEYDRNNRFS